MFDTSICELAGRMGTATRPMATLAKKATVQFGQFSARMATLPP